VKNTLGVGVENIVVIRFGVLSERFQNMDAGIRHNDIKPCHRFFGFVEQPSHVGGF